MAARFDLRERRRRRGDHALKHEGLDLAEIAPEDLAGKEEGLGSESPEPPPSRLLQV